MPRDAGPGAIVLALPFLLFSLFLAACEDRVPEVTPEEGDEVARIAGPVAGELLRTLVGRLTTAMEEGGPAHAVDFCSTEAIPLTQSVQSGFEEGTTLKRTSFRYRNPENAPDEAEAQALLYFEGVIEAGEAPPSSYVQRASKGEFRYYQPLFVNEFCLQCHGAGEAMTPEVRAALAEAYPEDLAMGYEAGDFRGVVRVSLPASRIAAPPGS